MSNEPSPILVYLAIASVIITFVVVYKIVFKK